MRRKGKEMSKKKISALVAATGALAACLAFFPAIAFAEVNIDDTVLTEGENSVGGGTATLSDSMLDMVNVIANNVTIKDESLTVNFNGGNKVKDEVTVTGSSDVTMNFSGENDVEDVQVAGNSTLTVNANGHDNLEELDAFDNANLIVNVTGENSIEEIIGTGNSNITIRGMSCQLKDILNIVDDERALLCVQNGTLTIDHVTINLQGSEWNMLGSLGGNLLVDTSKIAADDSAWTQVIAGGTLKLSESVVDIAGEVFSQGMMTIEHSDVDVDKPSSAESVMPYRVFSYEGIELIREKNGEVYEGEFDGSKVWYVDTDDNDGSDVDLKADGMPAYYKCSSSDKTVPKTGDSDVFLYFALSTLFALIAAAFVFRRLTAR